MPVWTDRDKGTPAEQAEWDRFLKALLAHEQAHIDLDRAAFKDLHKKCLGKSEEDADKEIDKAIVAADTANDEFDTKTDHGRNNGTKITIP